MKNTTLSQTEASNYLHKYGYNQGCRKIQIQKKYNYKLKTRYQYKQKYKLKYKHNAFSNKSIQLSAQILLQSRLPAIKYNCQFIDQCTAVATGMWSRKELLSELIKKIWVGFYLRIPWMTDVNIQESVIKRDQVREGLGIHISFNL